MVLVISGQAKRTTRRGQSRLQQRTVLQGNYETTGPQERDDPRSRQVAVEAEKEVMLPIQILVCHVLCHSNRKHLKTL